MNKYKNNKPCKILFDHIPVFFWIAVIAVVLMVMLSLNSQQAKKLPLYQVAGFYQSDTAIGAKIYYNAQLYTDGRYEVSRVENKETGASTTVISKGTYEAMDYGYLMVDVTTDRWQAITLDHVGFYWTDQELNRLTHFRQCSAYGRKQ